MGKREGDLLGGKITLGEISNLSKKQKVKYIDKKESRQNLRGGSGTKRSQRGLKAHQGQQSLKGASILETYTSGREGPSHHPGIQNFQVEEQEKRPAEQPTEKKKGKNFCAIFMSRPLRKESNRPREGSVSLRPRGLRKQQRRRLWNHITQTPTTRAHPGPRKGGRASHSLKGDRGGLGHTLER